MSRPIQKLTHNLVQKQSLVLTQDLQLFLKLIQMNTLELKEYLEQELIENPTLEEAEKSEADSTDAPEEGEAKPEQTLEELYKGVVGKDDGEFLRGYEEVYANGDDDLPSWENRVAESQSLHEHLQWQVELLDLEPRLIRIASLIIGNVDEDGYLQADPYDIALELLLEKYAKGEITVEPNGFGATLDQARATLERDDRYTREVEEVLVLLQGLLDPAGICARDLSECLAIQARNLGFKPECPIFDVIERHLEAIGSHDFDKIATELDISPTEIQELAATISSLEPRPGRPYFISDQEKFILPDYYIYKVGTEYQLQLNKDLPRIRISGYYRNFIRGNTELTPEEKKYIREKLESARRIIKCLEERNETIKKVLGQIIVVQRDFLEYGNDYIKPLRLKDIAEEVGVHESTVSRITSRRYIHTPRGTVELRSFFSRRIETSHGVDLSYDRLKSIIMDIVSDEPRTNPYSDEDISKILDRRNIKVARRTIAKYRKSLDLASSSQRARLYRDEDSVRG